MPFIAVFHIPDDHTADAIRAGDIPVSRRDMRIVGLYQFPNRADLTCTGCTSSKGNGWGRAPEGWMRCSTCGGRSRNVRRWLVGGLFDWLGANLLGDKAPALFRTPEGYGSRDDN